MHRHDMRMEETKRRNLLTTGFCRYWFVDSELFTPWQEWLIDVSLSLNAEAKRRAGEADAELAYRMSKEFMTR